MNMNLPIAVAALAATLCLALEAQAQQSTSIDVPAPQAAHIEVSYSSSLQGTEALYAVRVCVRSEEAPNQVVVRETLADGQDDIVIRVVDADGHEVSRYAGVAAVCDYAKFAAAYVARSGEAPTQGAR